MRRFVFSLRACVTSMAIGYAGLALAWEAFEGFGVADALGRAAWPLAALVGLTLLLVCDAEPRRRDRG